ncbi:thiol reductant ABC exporter subunit CydC [Cellulomonas sp. HD19AZ1]|uniref:thiol reductant ABC exporter subunit CydC n=1 Tax=Cellulomonas sp. HD19AZ1 TaxID=2559593 RepID=UPI0010708547|nr:thiol reductant ABC exporter subunit CydC [Cellulomonas sp. HD19AZ1]TFH74234.1 thiol reductant ABC exporter subunit CydC [Cellulomonas sp. HD19AZ1]
MTAAPTTVPATAATAARPPRGTLRRAVALLEVDPRRVALAVLLGTLALGSAVALAAASAWLIARASQMPPVLQLSVATVGVRAFGIGRGLMRYLERLVSHDVALRGMATLRTTLYGRLAAGSPRALLAVRRGDLLARVGADVDAVGDVVVRGLLPAGVAVTLGVGTSVAMALFWPPAGLALALCLLAAGVLAPWLAARGARTAEERGVAARARMSAVSLGVLDDAGPLAVSGRLPHELAALRDADADLARATDAGARPAALAAAVGQLAVGVAVLAALVTGVPAVRAGLLAPVELAVVVLTPLAAFEATSLLPAAAVQVQRSRAAAARVLALLDDAATPARARGAAPDAPVAATGPRGTTRTSVDDDGAPDPSEHGPVLVARGLACGWPGRGPAVAGVDLVLAPGARLAVAGPSGEGKTTLLLTLAGLLPPVAGTVTLDGVPLDRADRADVVRSVVVTGEDAHVFGTSVLENLRVARGDVTPEEATDALRRTGLGTWLAGLPDGLDTVLGSDARTVSGGERRRLLLARTLLSDAPLLLVDEPGEHLDPRTADAVLDELWHAPATREGAARGLVVVSHRLAPLAAADEVLWLTGGRVAARGTHAHLAAHVPGYGEAVRAEQRDLT